MPQPVTLTFPAGFDPLAASNTEVADMTRRLWLESANAALREEFAKLQEDGDAPDAQGIRPSDLELPPLDDDLADTVPLTEADLDLFRYPAALIETEDCRRCAGYGVIERSAVAGGPFPQCQTCNGTGRVPKKETPPC